MNLSSHISFLLFEHDCVILPGFGAFLAHQEPARIDERRGLIFPPSKRISFNRQINRNDGLLISRISDAETMAYGDVMRMVSHEIEELKNQLFHGKKVVIDGVGSIIPGKEKTWEFIPENQVNYLIDSFGLKPLRLPEPVAQPKEEVETVVRKLVPVSGKSHWKSIAAAAIAIPIIAASIYFGRDNGAQLMTFTQHLPWNKTIVAEYQPRFDEEGIAFESSPISHPLEDIKAEGQIDQLRFSFSRDEIAPDGVLVRFKEEKKVSNLNMYFIVGGAFRELSNADKMVADLQSKGYDAYIFGKKGDLHLVCYGSYTTRSAAKTALRTVKSKENKSAWLKRN